MKFLFLHGLESDPHGSKYQALNEIFGEVLAPNCTGVKDEAERLKIIQDDISREDGPFLVIGSSMGGLMALLLQKENPEQVAGLVLCAPAIHRPAAEKLDLNNLPPTVVIHGTRDEVVPLEVSRPFGKRLIEVDDDHRLSNSMPEILRAVFEMKLTLSVFGRP
ncbi:MAG: YqiA/YcfP family alpha/beta fold hydrolase [Desulfuromusa sp.]|nr:YqiA/YcfP family alpha/beta fold hydrolase [Desulfuromusa sp.]